MSNELIKQVVKTGVVPLTRATGFRKAGFTFRRRQGSVIHVLNVQSSHGSTAEREIFYLNVGIAFDDLSNLGGGGPVENPRVDACPFDTRVVSMIAGAPERACVG